MKKKIQLVFVFMVLVFLGTGCTSKEENSAKKYEVYYLHRDENHIMTLPYETVTPKAEKDFLVKELLMQLGTQRKEIEYKPAIVDFTVKDCMIHESQVNLNLSKEYEMMDFTKEVLVRAAIVKTLTQIEGIELVRFQVEGRDLEDRDGKAVGVMSAETFIDNTGEDMKKYEEVTMTLYFANETGEQLIKVNRTMRYNTNISLEKLVVEQLVHGPVGSKGKEEIQVYPTLNPETKIISVNIKDGICYVNLNNTFLTLNSNVTADTTIYSLVNSLTELPGVLKVQLAVDGETEVVLGDKMLSASFERNSDMVQNDK